MKANSADKNGIPDDKLGWFPFPTVAGGKGDPTDTLGGLNGWLVTKGSPKEAVEFLKFFSEPENQREAAERGFYIPVVNGTQDAIANPILRRIAENLGARSTTRSSTTRCSGRRSAPSSTTSRPTSPPGG